MTQGYAMKLHAQTLLISAELMPNTATQAQTPYVSPT